MVFKALLDRRVQPCGLLDGLEPDALGDYLCRTHVADVRPAGAG